MTEVVYSITVLGCNNFFPYEDKTLCVAWKAKKQKGETGAATVRHNNADLKSVFRVDAKLKPARKKEGEYERFPLHLSVLNVVGKKAKEIAACEVNLADFCKPKGDPYGAKVRIEWSVKVSKAFDSVLEKNPACILILIDPAGGAPLESPKVASGATPALEKKAVTPPASPKAKKTSAAAREVSSNPFASGASSEPKEKSVDESSEEPPSMPPPSSSNPFASLSRKVGGGPTNDSLDAVPSAAVTTTSTNMRRVSETEDPSALPALGAKASFHKSTGSNAGLTGSGGGGANAEASSDKDARKLAAENRKLREQLDKAEERRNESSKKVQTLQAKLKTLEKAVPKSSMKELRKDGYVREGTLQGPSSVTGDGQIGENIIMSVRAVLDDPDQANFQTVIYWLSWATNLHMVLSAQRGRKSSFVENGVDPNKRAMSVTPDRGTMRHFVWELEQIVEEAYRHSIRVITRDIRNIVDRKVRSFWDVEVESSVVGQDVVDNFERWFVAMANCGIPTPVLNQWMYQALYILNATIFNSFLENPRLLEATIALQIKFYTSELENWGSQHAKTLYHWRSFRGQLQPLVDLSNLLLLDKANIDVSMLRDGAPSLSLTQVKFLLDVYSEVAPDYDRVPVNVLKEVSEAAQMDASQRVPLDRAMFPERWFVLQDLVSRVSSGPSFA